MEIHKPTPWHGWREFLKEYLIIVVGVLTALAAEQLVETLRWQEQARSAEEQLADGVRINLRNAADWMAARQCNQARLVELSTALKNASGHWRAMPVSYIDSIGGQSRVTPTVMMSPNPLWTHDAWENAVSTGVLSHMPRDRVARYGAAYRVVELARTWQIQGRLASDELGALAYDGDLSSPDRAKYLSALAQVETYQNGLATNSRYLFLQANALGVGITQREADAETAKNRARLGACALQVKLPIR